MMSTRYEIQADGGSRGNPGPAAYGVLISVDGTPVRELAETIGVATNNVAEYRGLVAGLRWLAEHGDGVGEVRVLMDSRLVVEQMAGRWRIKHPDMRSLAVQARGLFPPERVRYQWIPRGENHRADALVNEALDSGLPDGFRIDRQP